MKSPVTISVFELFKASALHSREQAKELFSTILKIMRNHEPVWIDFSNIEFISRSFADELVHLKMNSKEKSLINFCCTSITVNDIFDAVAHSQSKKKTEKKLPVQKFDSLESLMKYFSKI
jgi:anti-anti-sigma regulatory factor